MVNTNSYHHYVFFSSANVVTGNLGGFVGGISDYFGLRGANEELLRQNMVLMEQVRDLQTRNNMLEQAISQDSLPVLPLAVDTTLSPDRNFRFIEAKILNLTVNRRLNYITLNKGARDGVSDNMGVICSDGVVGTVAMVSEKFSLVLPIINLQSKTSCRLDSCEYLGSLVWDEQDPLYAGLEEIPRHADVKVGDKVCTSGFSDIFPIGIPVGTVSEAEVTDADNFYSIKVRLSADFQRLTGVYVVAFEDNAELMQLTDSVSTLNAHGR